MPLTPKKRYANRGARRATRTAPGNAATIARRTPITITDVTVGTSTVVTFDQVVSLAGIPAYPSQAAALPTAAEVTAPNEVTLTYAVAPTTIIVPFEDPAVRNGAGGYVLPGTFPAA